MNIYYTVSEDTKHYNWYQIKQKFSNISFPAEDTISVESLARLGITKYEEDYSLDYYKSLKLQEVKAWTESKITGGFISQCTGESVKYDSDTDTQITMQGIALNAENISSYYPSGIPVRGYKSEETEKSIRYLTGKQLLQWCADLSIHIGISKQAGWKKQYEVSQATTKEELDKIILI